MIKLCAPQIIQMRNSDSHNKILGDLFVVIIVVVMLVLFTLTINDTIPVRCSQAAAGGRNLN